MVVSAEEVIVTESGDLTKKSKRKGEKRGSACDAEKTAAITSITSEEPVKKKKKTKIQIADSSNNDDKLNSTSEDTNIYDENISKSTEKTGKKRKKKAKHYNDSAPAKSLNVTLETDQMLNAETHSAKIAEITTENCESTLNKTGKKKKKTKKKQRDSEPAEPKEVTLENTHTPTITGDENLEPDDVSKKSGEEIEKCIKKKKTKKARGDVEPEQTSIKSPGKDQEQNRNPIQVESSENVETNLSKNGSDSEKIKKKKKKEKRGLEDKALKSISDDVQSDQDAKNVKGPTDAPKQGEIDPNYEAMNFKANSSKTKKKKKDQKENNSESKENKTEKDTKSLGEDTASQKTEGSKNETEPSIGEIEEPNSENSSSKSRKRKKDKKRTQESKNETHDQNNQNKKSSTTPETVTSVSDLDQFTRKKKKKRKEQSENQSLGENVKTDPPCGKSGALTTKKVEDDNADPPSAESGALTTKKVEDETADELGRQIEPENTSEAQSAKKKKKSKKSKKKQGGETEEQNADESASESKANKKSMKRKVESTISGEASKNDEGTQSCEKKKKVKKEKVSAVSTPSIENELTSEKTAGETTAKELPKKKKRKKAQSDESEMNGKTAAEDSKNGDGETDPGQSKELDQNPKQECSTANDRLGQWKTAKLSSSVQQDKFVRLLGGTKLAPAKKDSPASTLNGESILSRLSGVWKPPPGRKLFRSLMNREKKTFSSVALDEKESEELATNLENQYNKTLDFNLQKRKEGNAAKGLGFQEDPAKGKQHYIDINKVNSIALD